MAINAVPLTILDQLGAIGATGPTIPVVTGELGGGAFKRGIGSGTERTRAQQRVILNVGRQDGAGAALAGAFAIWGANAADALSGKSVGNAFAPTPADNAAAFFAVPRTDGTASPLVGQANLDTLIPFVAFSNYNWIVVRNGVVLAQGSGAGRYTVANNSGNARIVLGTNVAAFDDIAVYFVVPVQIMADGVHAYEMVGVPSAQFVWTNWSADQGADDRTVVTMLPAVGGA